MLIDRDLLLTAGHCVKDEEDCSENAFVFDYAYRRAGELETISASDVYGCRRIVARTFTDAGPDYAVIQLDRVPTGRTPVEIRKDPLRDGESLAVLGFTSGLPMKVDLAATVRASMSDYFLLDSDTYEGSSGSAVLDSDNALAGVLVRGGEDYVETAEGCQVSKVYSGDRRPSWGWEQASYTSQALEELCEEVGFPSERLCGIKPRCGDGFCSFDVADRGCVEDCEDVCTDGDCTKGGGSSGGPLVPSSGDDGDSEAKSSGCSITGPAQASRSLEGLSLLALVFALAVRASRRRA